MERETPEPAKKAVKQISSASTTHRQDHLSAGLIKRQAHTVPVITLALIEGTDLQLEPGQAAHSPHHTTTGAQHMPKSMRHSCSIHVHMLCMWGGKS